MAKVITDEMETRAVSAFYSWWRVALVGAAIGLLFLTLSFLVSHFLIEPLFCHSSANALTCAKSVGIAGDIATILAATAGVAVLVVLHILRPLIIAAATAAILWGLAGWTHGLGWGEIALWSALLYGLSYVLFSWISRLNRSIPVLVSVLALVIIARFVFILQ